MLVKESTQSQNICYNEICLSVSQALMLSCLSFMVVSRKQNGESKPLTVPKDIDLHLETAPVKAMDALGKNQISFENLNIQNYCKRSPTILLL